MVLDTHVWIWLVTGRAPLSSVIRRALNESRVAISAISISEVLCLLERSRIHSMVGHEQTVREFLKAYPVEILSVDKEIAILSRTLKFTHGDPADRLIAATAFANQMPLATADTKLIALPWLETIS